MRVGVRKGKHALDMSAKILSGLQTGNNRNSNYVVRTLMNMALRSCDRCILEEKRIIKFS